MPNFEMKMDVKGLAGDLGDSLVDRLKNYLKDAADTEFLKEIALEMAQLQYKAATAATERDRERATVDIDFLHARISTFTASQALKFRSEALETVEEILKTVGVVMGTFASAALKGMTGI